ncbi:MAG TPA: hypothetical protein VE422_13795 [Terriglobia bacterium]|nr:hypothetical protein [Terriglobia bacterium]
MSKRAIWCVVALSVAGLVQAQGQRPAGSLPGTFTHIPKADVERVQQQIFRMEIPNDAPVRMVDAGRYNLGAYTLFMQPTTRPAGAPANGFYHRDIAEVYLLVSGSGSWRVGGEIENPVEEPDDRSRREVRGPSVTGTLKGFTDQKLNAGDILIVGPGVPHSPGDFTEPTKIIRVAIDPHKVMPLVPAPAGYTPKAVPVSTARPTPNLPGAWAYVSKADIDKLMKDMEQPGVYGDQAVRTIDLPTINYRVGLYVLHTRMMPATPPTPAKNGWYHTSIAEIYYFPRGAGSFMVGGTLENPTQDDPKSYATTTVRGPSVSGRFKGATMQKTEAGDLLIIPTGVPHTPTVITAAPRDILRIAIDPDHVLPLK